MCGTCGCGSATVPGGGAEAATAGGTPAEIAPSSTRQLTLQRRLLERNDLQAAANRHHFEQHDLLALNLLSAPGSGKTALLEQLATRWPRPPVGVIVGDLATDNDARRLQAAGARAVQIRTGDLCHLEAHLVERAFAQLDSTGMELLVIENVGNLVCPTGFDLGEHLRLAVLSVTEGEDKPLKYPGLFRSADAVLLNKIDLAEAVDFRRDEALANLAAITPAARVFEVSARSGAGLAELIGWLEQQRRQRGLQARAHQHGHGHPHAHG